MESRPEGVRRSTGVGYVARRGTRVRRGVQSAKDQVDSAYRTVPGEEVAIAPPFGDVPLRSGSGERRLIPTYAPGHGNWTPGFH